MAVNAQDLRQRIAGWRAAERREQALRASEGPLPPAVALRAAFELYDLLPVDLRGPDATRVREVERSRRTWRTLRIRLTSR